MLNQLTTEEFGRLTRTGQSCAHVELIDGKLFDVASFSSCELIQLQRLSLVLGALGGSQQLVVGMQCPLVFPPTSQPLPALILFKSERFWRTEHLRFPKVAALIVEIAAISTELVQAKIKIYAKHGMPEVWLLNGAGRKLGVYRRPVNDRYEDAREYGAGDLITPVSIVEGAVRLSQVFFR